MARADHNNTSLYGQNHMSIAIELEKLKKLRDSGDLTAAQFEQAKNQLLDACVSKIESSYKAGPTRRVRLQLVPSVRVVRGVAQNVRVVPGKQAGQSVSLDVGGRPVDISSSASLEVDAGDRVTLAGYERNGRVLAVAYHNETTGAHSDLGRLRKGYRVLLAVGQIGLWAGLVAILATGLILVLHRQAGTFTAGLRAYAPYALALLAAAAVAHFGLGLSFLGKKTKEFHDAMSASVSNTD